MNNSNSCSQFDTAKQHGGIVQVACIFAFMLACTYCAVALADDTEIYQASYAAITEGSRPKVLIIFDDSGSMDTEVAAQPEPYDPDTLYSGDADADKLYWTTDGSVADSNSGRWFTASANRCAESIQPLQNQGVFQGKMQYARERKNRWSWSDLSTRRRNPDHIDCETDVINSNPSNPGYTEGYPLESSSLPYTDAVGDSNIDRRWGDNVYTVYTANYVNWSESSGSVTRTRLDIAQETLTNLISSNPGIDFGLTLFNNNSSDRNGGAIVQRVIDNMDATARNNLLANIDNTTAAGYTPLCESMYEAYRYLTGDNVLYGNQRGSENPPKDNTAESAGHYDSPLTECAYIYIILMTDGEPYADTDANTRIESLTAKTCDSYPSDGGSLRKNCLPTLAEHMANTDLDGDPDSGNQFAITYTIGFATDQQLLSDTARKGKGKYFTADSAQGLTEAFQGAITSILATNASFTSPAIAVDTFTKTESLDEVYYAMFKPGERIDWPGNIKKLKLDSVNDTLTDADGADAIDATTGKIKDTARTYWSSSIDGEDVSSGGAGALLAARDPSTRIIYSDTGTNASLEQFSAANMDADAFEFDSDQMLFDFFGAIDQSDLNNTINWARGYDVDDLNDDGSTTDTREWVLADMLHSRPVVLQYGGVINDKRIVAGTNAGFLHMFHNDDGISHQGGDEAWAFFPKALAPVLAKRRNNPISSEHVYGIDATPVSYVDDVDQDGNIESADGDKLYLYFGLRRGGNMLYALDLSIADSPSLLWSIDNNSTGFEELGQTWSAPTISNIPGYFDADSRPKPVLIFGAGYDPAKDAIDSLATPDSQGRGIFIVDAVTGNKVWSVTPDNNSTTNLQERALLHSVPATISTLDSNGDRLTDRIYFADSGGNLWRIDMPGNALPTANQDTWQITQLAAINGGTAASDRRFFSAPDIIRARGIVTRCTQYQQDDSCATTDDGQLLEITQNTPFDAILIGSGDRTNPNGTDVSNRFYMFRDLNTGIISSPHPNQSDTDCATLLTDDNHYNNDFRCFLPLTETDLVNTTNNISSNQSHSQHGWFIELADSGEKSLSRSLTLANKVFFTTFSPNTIIADQCTAQAGLGRLYVVDLLDSSAGYNFNNSPAFDLISDRAVTLGSLIPDTPAPHLGSDKKIRLLFPSGGGAPKGLVLDSGIELPGTNSTYWYEEEQ